MSNETPCILYEGTRDKRGYGILPKAINGSRLAHRAALAQKLGRPVNGVSRHTCDNPPCINPDHLLEGTHADNVNDAVERGRNRGGRYAQTHCKNGHELTPENIRITTRQSTRSVANVRICMICRHKYNTDQAARKKAARHARGLKIQRKAPAHV